LVRAVLSDAPEVEIAGEAGDGRACLEGVEETHPDLLLLDLRMPGMDGFEVLDELRERAGSSPRVLVLTSSPPEEVADRVHAAGADYLRKGAPPDVLLDAVRSLAA
jgi:DNA-binding NarL/FixJ family response regulator